MGAYLFTNCPTCGASTVQHLTPAGSYICQECENERQIKPSEMISGGMRRILLPPSNLQAKIDKAIGKDE